MKAPLSLIKEFVDNKNLSLYNKKVIMRGNYNDKVFYLTNIEDKFHLIVYGEKVFSLTDMEVLNFVIDYICKLLKD